VSTGEKYRTRGFFSFLRQNCIVGESELRKYSFPFVDIVLIWSYKIKELKNRCICIKFFTFSQWQKKKVNGSRLVDILYVLICVYCILVPGTIDMLRVAGGKMEILRRSGSNNSDLAFHDLIFTAKE
jgi:hypothetical protein